MSERERIKFDSPANGDYICEECGHRFLVESNIYREFPRRKDCPKCEAKKSCYKDWKSSGSITIPESCQALKMDSGREWAKQRMKNYKGQGRTSKRYY